MPSGILPIFGHPTFAYLGREFSAGTETSPYAGPVQPKELFKEIEARALALQPPPGPVEAAVERLRLEWVAFFDQVPEPPLYRRAEDPVRRAAEALVERGGELLARSWVLAPQESSVGSLAAAGRAYLESLCHTADGRLEQADRAWHQAGELERAATSARRLWARSDEVSLPVFDPATGASRYDPRPEPMVKVKLACPVDSCRQISDYRFSPRHPTHPLVCSTCRAGFLAHFGEVRSVEVSEPVRGQRSYRFRIEELAGGWSRVEFDDASGGVLSVARRDLIAFLYTVDRTLRGVLDLSSGRLLWIQRGGPCFIATVAFGEGAPELEPFRAFRDRVLRRTALGSALVRGYYFAGPALARGLSRSPLGVKLARAGLVRLHRYLRRSGL
jgi:hypothetical protein